MYPAYFGLKEPSFSIAPDPRYLFLSEQHREALAHLLYGAGEDGGFVLLTGEVGTGKTTVCRAFLEQLPESVDLALILNPALTANELLLTLCEEFQLPVPPGESRSIKRLIDRINRYLLEAHARGRRPLVIIDEAQNLSPRVMEQVRLLTNLETTRHKLLRIFLIGQPELRRLLAREELRQIDQRITARFHLCPLTRRETGDYIRHRLAVAGVERPLFTAAAIRRIHQYTGGIPRPINILCDRALLGACVTRVAQVTPAIVARAAREVWGETPRRRPERPPARPAFVAALAVAMSALLGWQGYQWLDRGGPAHWIWTIGRLTDPPVPPEAPPVTTEPAPAEEAPVAAAAPPVGDSVSVPKQPPLARIALPLHRLAQPEPEALRILLRLWRVDASLPGPVDSCAQVAATGLQCLRGRGTLDELRVLDRPALLRVRDPAGTDGFLALGALAADGTATLEFAAGRGTALPAVLMAEWTGEYLLLWQPPPSGRAIVGGVAPPDDVRWLRQLLNRVPELALPPDDAPEFDQRMRTALRAFQRARGLRADGLAGPLTLIQLQNRANLPGMPRLLSHADPAPNPRAEGE